MKTTIERIFETLSKEKVELKSEKIELALVDDFEKSFNKALSDNTAEKLIDNLRKAEVGFEKALKEFNKILKEGETIKVLSKDLGVDIPKPVLNKINSTAELVKDYNKYISKVKSMYNMF